MNTINDLLKIMAELRDPETGCPWDQEQDFSTIAPYTLEEAYEVQDCIQRHAFEELKYELGDLLLQVVYHSQMAKEANLFCFEDVVAAICEKMVRRHPHVFGGDERIESAEEQSQAWEAIKQAEKRETAEKDSLLADVMVAQPALKRATEIQKKAAKVGFDWLEIEPVIAKIEEELTELKTEVLETKNPDAIRDEIGDLLFACVNLSRHTKVDAEYALGLTNQKFIRRFQFIEKRLTELDKAFEEMNLDQLDQIWNEAKRMEKTGESTMTDD